jgi:hypothetical protein
MKDGVERVWFSAVVRLQLRRLKEKTGVPVSRFVRECVLERLGDQKGLDEVCDRLMLEIELKQLHGELDRLREVQNAILASYVYLRDYIRELMKGEYRNPACVDFRRSILCYPGAEKALPALEKVFARREQVGARMCEIVGLLYPDLKYDALDVFKGEYQSQHEQVSWSPVTKKKNDVGGENDGKTA